MPEPILFLLDDSQEMQEMVQACAARCGWHLISARCLEEAKDVCGADSQKFDAAMLDIMLPLSSESLRKVDEQIKIRNETCSIITRRGPGPDYTRQREEAKLKLNTIDKKIMDLIADDGGVQFLQSEEGKRLVGLPGIKVAIFSARRRDVTIKGQAADLQSQVKAVIDKKELDAWFEKPVSPLDLEEWLVNNKPT